MVSMDRSVNGVPLCPPAAQIDVYPKLWGHPVIIDVVDETGFGRIISRCSVEEAKVETTEKPVAKTEEAPAEEKKEENK